MLITKKKLHFSLICSFYFCLVKGGWAMKVAKQFAIQGLIAYKPVGYKKLGAITNKTTKLKICIHM